MNIQYCSICSTSFDFDIEGDKGMIGMIPFAFCATCRSGVIEYVYAGPMTATEIRVKQDPKRIPFETFKEPVCRGCPTIGNNCGHCEKCEWLLEHRSAGFG